MIFELISLWFQAHIAEIVCEWYSEIFDLFIETYCVARRHQPLVRRGSGLPRMSVLSCTWRSFLNGTAVESNASNKKRTGLQNLAYEKISVMKKTVYFPFSLEIRNFHCIAYETPFFFFQIQNYQQLHPDMSLIILTEFGNAEELISYGMHWHFINKVVMLRLPWTWNLFRQKLNISKASHVFFIHRCRLIFPAIITVFYHNVMMVLSSLG